MTIGEWIGVLRLAQMWSFEEERRKAINTLDDLLGEGMIVRKLSIARQFDVQEWLQPICEELTTRTTALTPEQIPWLDATFFHDLGRAREAHYKAVLFRLLQAVFKPKCFCGGLLGAEERPVQMGPEWYFNCNDCSRVFTLDDAVRMSSGDRDRRASKMRDDTTQIVKNILVRRLTSPGHRSQRPGFSSGQEGANTISH